MLKIAPRGWRKTLCVEFRPRPADDVPTTVKALRELIMVACNDDLGLDVLAALCAAWRSSPQAASCCGAGLSGQDELLAQDVEGYVCWLGSSCNLPRVAERFALRPEGAVIALHGACRREQKAVAEAIIRRLPETVSALADDLVLPDLRSDASAGHPWLCCRTGVRWLHALAAECGVVRPWPRDFLVGLLDQLDYAIRTNLGHARPTEDLRSLAGWLAEVIEGYDS